MLRAKKSRCLNFVRGITRKAYEELLVLDEIGGSLLAKGRYFMI